MVPNSLEGGVTPPAFKSSGNLFFGKGHREDAEGARPTTYVQHKLPVLCERWQSCDSGILDLISAFKELWGLPWESGELAMTVV